MLQQTVSQWVPFKMRKDYIFFMSMALFLLQHIGWLIHVPFTQFNVTSIGIGYYMILSFTLYPS